MKAVTLAELATAIGAEMPTAGGDLMVSSGVSTDTRSLVGGELFVALRGDRFDGHDYASAALDAGAVGVLVDDASAAAGRPVQLLCRILWLDCNVLLIGGVVSWLSQ